MSTPTPTPAVLALLTAARSALLEADESLRLQQSMKRLEHRRHAGSFGIRVSLDPLAQEWQGLERRVAKLQEQREIVLDALTAVLEGAPDVEVY